MNDRTWELLQKHLDSGSFYLVSSQDSAPSGETLLKVAKDLGCSFPEEYLVHATNKYGGVYVEVKEELWPRPKEFDVGPFWSFLYGLFVYSFASEIPEFMDIRRRGEEFQADTSLIAVPFLKIIGDADVYCFDQAGKIARWDHEQNLLEPQTKSFFEILDYELGQLRERKEHINIAERT